MSGWLNACTSLTHKNHSLEGCGYLFGHPECADRAAPTTAALADVTMRPDDRLLIMLADGPRFVEALLRCEVVGR